MPLDMDRVVRRYITDFRANRESPKVNVMVGKEMFAVSAMDLYAAFNTCVMQEKTGRSGAAAYLRAGKSKALSGMDYVDINEWPEHGAQTREHAREKRKEFTISLRHVVVIP